MKTLNIADNLKLPLEAVTETFGILAKRGAGKTYTAKVMAEEMLEKGMQVVALDPLGAWWGLRASADGKSPGLPIVVMGGDHGDLPIDCESGKLVATLIMAERFSVILDMSLMRKAQQRRFVTAFAEELYHKNREPLHLMIDEADAFAPQRPQKGDERMLGAIEDIVRRGRIRGLGCTLITQRSSVLNKNVLTQIEVLICLRTTAPHDIKAIEAWIEQHDTDDKGEEVLKSLPSLPVGTAWFWSPGFLDILKRVKVRQARTFDSSATPKLGKKIRQPKRLAPVDLERLKEGLQETIEKAKQNDPAALRAEVVKLRNRVEAMSRTEKVVAQKPKIVEVPILKASDFKRLENLVARAEKAGKQVGEAVAGVLDTVVKRLPVVCPTPAGNIIRPRPFLKPAMEARTKVMKRAITDLTHKVVREAKGIKTTPGAAPDGALGKGERAILIIIAQAGGAVTKVQMTVMTGYRRSTRDTYLQKLGQRQYVECMGNAWTATQQGIDALGNDYQPLPTGEALREFWLNKLARGEKTILAHVIYAHPNTMSRDNLSEITGYKRSSRDTYLQKLTARKLVEFVGQGEVKASDLLFQ